jgi:hypothetical protein
MADDVKDTGSVSRNTSHGRYAESADCARPQPRIPFLVPAGPIAAVARPAIPRHAANVHLRAIHLDHFAQTNRTDAIAKAKAKA